MKNAMLAILLLPFLCSCSLEQRSIEPNEEDPGGQYRIPQTKGPIAIDGRLDEWQSITGKNIDSAEQVAIWQGQNADAPPPDYSPDDLSAVFWAQWDQANLYIAIKVTDDTLLPPDHSPTTASNWWLDDEVEMSFDLGHNTVNSEHDDDDAIICFTFNTSYVYGGLDYRDELGELGPRFQGEHAHHIVDATTYILEVRIPFADIDPAFNAQIGTKIRFDISPEDEDSPGKGRDGQLFWVHRDVNAWTDASQWGTLIFVKAQQ